MPPRPREVPIVFYLGCNALRTPHVLFNAMRLLDALEVDYEVVGSPSSCCGVIAAKWEGEVRMGEKVTRNVVARFEEFVPQKGAQLVPDLCVTSGGTLGGFQKTSFDFDHLTTHLVSNLTQLGARFVKPIPKRVVLHAPVGYADTGANVGRLLTAIPDLDLIKIEWESGYTCGGSGCSKSPELAARGHAALLERCATPRPTCGRSGDALPRLPHGVS